jgi:2,3-bisphosphoglycerate-independent phosphoglycerate mutase
MNTSLDDSQSALLVILDGFGIADNSPYNAISQAHTPNWDKLWTLCPKTKLQASEAAVGLPNKQMGNSEVGHLNMGCGRTIEQELVRISGTIHNNQLNTVPALKPILNHLKQHKGRVHLMGLFSPGGVHAHQDHFLGLLDYFKANQVSNTFIHAFLDGRDVPPQSACNDLKKLNEYINNHHYGQLASICGRFYAMDRDQRWDRAQACYNMLVSGSDHLSTDPQKTIEDYYQQACYDEFIPATSIADQQGNPIVLQPGDVVIHMNFRSDRGKQLIQALTQEDFPHFRTQQIPNLVVATMTPYPSTQVDHTLFQQQTLKLTLGEVWSNQGLNQLRIAETEKYAHVTYFFNGGREQPYPNESRELIASPKVSTYDQKPEMSAVELTNKLIKALQSNHYQAIVCNYANADMVGHTGNLKATIRAIETLDQCLEKLTVACQKQGTHLFITADHGNAEMMYDPKIKQPHTAHTTNPVPFVYFGPKNPTFKPHGCLADIAPTICHILNHPIPEEMNGTSLMISLDE